MNIQERDVMANLREFLEEAHQGEMENDHGGDESECSYCTAIEQAGTLLCAPARTDLFEAASGMCQLFAGKGGDNRRWVKPYRDLVECGDETIELSLKPSRIVALMEATAEAANETAPTRPTPIVSVVFVDAETWLKANLPDLGVDSVSAVHPTNHAPIIFDGDGLIEYEDEEDGKRYHKTLADHVEALRMLAHMIDNKKLFVGGLKAAVDLQDAGNWDVEVVDAYFQLVALGEVTYG